MAIELDHSFTVPVPPDQAWDVLLDVKTIAPCMPGATVDEVDGDVVNGRIKVKVGPVSLTYKGTAKFTERNPETRVVVVEAAGKETRGAGTASATVRASLAPEASGTGTEVTMHTTMNVTGLAQFGRGVMVEVGGKLVEQFAANLAKLIAGDTGAAASGGDAGSADAGSGDAGSSAPTGTSDAGTSDAGTSAGVGGDGASAPAAATAARTGNGSGAAAVAAAAAPVASTSAPAQEDSLNLVKLAGPVVLKRLVPVVAGAAALALLSRLLWRLRHRAERAEKA